MLTLSITITSNSRICQESADQCAHAIRRAASVEENLQCASDTDAQDDQGRESIQVHPSCCDDDWARNWLDDAYTPSDEEDSDGGENTDQERDNDEGCNHSEQRVPFWFSNEEPGHSHRVVKEYSRFLNLVEPDRGSRQLPTFVGRIERQPVETDQEETNFTTLDTVVIYRRDMRQVGSTVTAVQEEVVLTTWDDDGVPLKFSLRAEADLRDWQRYHKFSSPSFIYCLPVWYSDDEFSYEVCSLRKEVGYSKEPFNFTKYIPQHYRPQVAECPS